jgi:hypothetical protein
MPHMDALTSVRALYQGPTQIHVVVDVTLDKPSRMLVDALRMIL